MIYQAQGLLFLYLCSDYSLLSVWLDLEWPMKHTSLCVYEGISKEVWQRREHRPENRPYHPLDRDPRLNQNGQRRNLLVPNVPASFLQRQFGKWLRDPATIPSCSIHCKLKPWGKTNASSLNEALVTASGKVMDAIFCAKLLVLGDLIGKFRESPYHSACT